MRKKARGPCLLTLLGQTATIHSYTSTIRRRRRRERETGGEGKREREREQLMDILCIINKCKKPFLMEYLVSERGEERREREREGGKRKSKKVI